MIDRKALMADMGEYEQQRAKNKLGIVAMYLVFIKCTICLAIFGFPEIFVKSGYYLGSAIGLTFIHMVIHGSMRLAQYAAEIEQFSEYKGCRVDTYFELSELMYPEGSKVGKVAGPLVFALTFVSTIGYMLSMTIGFAKNLEELLHVGALASRAIILAISILALYLMVQPEKIKYFSYFTCALVIALAFASFGLGIYKLGTDGVDTDYIESASFSEMSVSVGYAITCMEVINYILNLRRLMADKTKFSFVGYSSLYFCAAVYYVPSVILYLGFAKTIGDYQIYFWMFLDYWPIRYLNYLMNLNFLYGITTLTIFNIEMLEKVRAAQKYLRDSEGALKSLNVLACRIVFISGVITLSYFMTDLRIVYAITGIFLNSFVGMIIPGFLGLTRSNTYRFKDSLYTSVMDWMCVLFGISSLGLYIFDLLDN